jgi:hypothetical protein
MPRVEDSKIGQVPNQAVAKGTRQISNVVKTFDLDYEFGHLNTAPWDFLDLLFTPRLSERNKKKFHFDHPLLCQ